MAPGIRPILVDPLHQNILLYRVENEFSEDIEQVELCQSLYESLKFLPDDYATVVRMYLEGWKPEEIATKLGLALQTVYNKRWEAILILRKHMVK